MNNTMLREFATMNNAMNKFFENQYGPYDYSRNGGSANANGQSTPPTISRLPIDVQAVEDAFVVTAYLPGVQPDSVEITFEKDELTVKGQFPKQVEGNHYIKNELFHGAFQRTLTFTTPVDVEAIEAHFENGVLTLRIPKAAEAKPKKIAVTSK